MRRHAPIDCSNMESNPHRLGERPLRCAEGVFSSRRVLREHPFICFLALLFGVAALMCVGAVHNTGMDRILLGSWGRLSW